jgi:hypothetical protein
LKNYFEHDDKVRFVEALLSKNQDWRWFIQLIEATYEINEITTYEEFEKEKSNIFELIQKFYDILTVCDAFFNSDKKFILELQYISRFRKGIISKEDCLKNITSNWGKIVYLYILVTKLIVNYNGEMIIDTRIGTQKNFFQLIKFDELMLNKEEIKLFINDLELENSNKWKNCFIDNIDEKFFAPSRKFLEKNKSKFQNVNAFNFQRTEKRDFLTWQEDALLDMVNISIKKEKITPSMVWDGKNYPDYELWSEEFLNSIRNYFNNKIVDFVVETINYVKNNVMPSFYTINEHCKMLLESNEKSWSKDIQNLSSFHFLSGLFKNKKMKSIERKEDLLKLINTVQMQEDIDVLLVLKDNNFYLSKEQKLILKKHIEEKFKRIEEINTADELCEYLSDTDVSKYIEYKYLTQVTQKFQSMVEEREYALPLFCSLFNFLIGVETQNQSVDKQEIKNLLIGTQKLWSNKFYIEVCKDLKEFRDCQRFTKESIDSFSALIIEEPSVFCQYFPLKEKELIDVIRLVSENCVFEGLAKTFVLDEQFPFELRGSLDQSSEINEIYFSVLDKIKKQNGYKFLNNLENSFYMEKIYELIKREAQKMAVVFNRTKELYDNVEKRSGVKFINFSTDINIGHITQLFPILEIEIRKFGELLGIVPFKEQKLGPLKFKDPSSILREFMTIVYDRTGSLDAIADLVFVYHAMYNKDCLNIRNDSIHGRGYLNEMDINWAFKITLISTYIIMRRIEIIVNRTNEI